MSKRLPFALVCIAFVAAVSPSGPTLEAQSSCTVPTHNRVVRDALFEYYYWNHDLPSVNPSTFASPQAYLEAVRYKPLDRPTPASPAAPTRTPSIPPASSSGWG